MQFELSTAGRIRFGRGVLGEVGSRSRELGERALVVCGQSPARIQRLLGLLAEAGVDCVTHSIAGEPTLECVARGVLRARETDRDLVVACGGGSALDGGKAIAAFLTNEGDPLDHLEVVGRGLPLRRAPLPVLAVPTTAGTGSEVTRNAVLGVPAERVKVSLRDHRLLPRVALVDPELTLTKPPTLTVSTGLDALTQLVEPYLCRCPNPLTDAFCREGMQRVARSLRRAYRYGHDLRAREDLALASLLGGMALTSARLGAVHGLAAPLGGLLAAPHGALCAALLPHVMEVNLRALRERQPESDARRRLDEAARLLTGEPTASAPVGVAWVRQLCRDLDVAGLGRLGLQRDAFDEVISRARRSSSMQGNPVELTEGELREILQRAF